MSSARPVTAHVASQTVTLSDHTQVEAESVSTDTAPALSGLVNSLPLFGERPKTATQIDAEIHFLNDCDRNFATRTEASEFFAARGWDYVADGQLDTAAYRFNLAWVLNDRNPDAYWGLGVVSYQKEDLPLAIRMLKKGLDVTDTNTELLGDLATVQIKQFQHDHNRDNLDQAEQHLQRIITLTPTHAASFQKLALVSYLKTDYEKAWTFFHQARELDLSVLDLSFLNDLMSKRPDPKGVFK